jgi:hypothetical protein
VAETDCSTKACSKCKAIKPLDDFHRMNSGSSTGRVPRCKECVKEIYPNNRAKINAYLLARYHKRHKPIKEAKAAQRQARIDSPNKLCKKCGKTKPKNEFQYSSQRLDKCYPSCKECKNREVRARPKVKEKGQVRLRRAISCKLRLAIYSGKMSKKTADIVGYSLKELFTHIEKQFVDGMSWENYGTWHLDHILPVSSFKFQGIDDPEVRRAWALSNLRPLWATDNLRKNKKIIYLI